MATFRSFCKTSFVKRQEAAAKIWRFANGETIHLKPTPVVFHLFF